MNELGKRLRELRESKNMSQVELAKVLGKSQVAISKYENGNRQLDYEMLNKYSKFFNVSTDYLIGMVDQPNELCLNANDYPEVLKPFHLDGKSVIKLLTNNFSEEITSADKKLMLEKFLKETSLNEFINQIQKSKESKLIEQIDRLISYLPKDLANPSLYECFEYFESNANVMNSLKNNSSYNENGELSIEKVNGDSTPSLFSKTIQIEKEKLSDKVEEPDVTYNDFTYALHNETKELTEENKQKLLEMARFFKEQQDKKKKQ